MRRDGGRARQRPCVADAHELVADPGTWSGDGISFAYAWERCDSAGANCAPVAGATVHAERLVGDAAATMDVVTGEDGRFTMPDILGGRFRDAVPFSAYLFYKHAGIGGTDGVAPRPRRRPEAAST